MVLAVERACDSQRLPIEAQRLVEIAPVAERAAELASGRERGEVDLPEQLALSLQRRPQQFDRLVEAALLKEDVTQVTRRFERKRRPGSDGRQDVAQLALGLLVALGGPVGARQPPPH